MLYVEQGQKGGTMEGMNELLRHGSIQQIVESLLEKAVASGASDIHMEPLDEEVDIRFRMVSFALYRCCLNRCCHN